MKTKRVKRVKKSGIIGGVRGGYVPSEELTPAPTFGSCSLTKEDELWLSMHTKPSKRYGV
jgi:hypothetical protein